MFNSGYIKNLMLDKIIKLVLRQISPELKKYFAALLYELDKKARATSNPYDDVLMDVLYEVTGIPKPKTELAEKK